MNSSLFVLHLFMINVFDIVHKRLVAEFRAAWGWIMTGEIPVALVVWNRLAQALDALEHELDRSSHALWAKHLYYLLVDFLGGEWLVDSAHWVHLLLLRLGKFSLACLVGLLGPPSCALSKAGLPHGTRRTLPVLPYRCRNNPDNGSEEHWIRLQSS